MKKEIATTPAAASQSTTEPTPSAPIPPSTNADTSAVGTALNSVATSSFTVDFDVKGVPDVRAITLSWKAPNMRIDLSMNGQPLRLYLNANGDMMDRNTAVLCAGPPTAQSCKPAGLSGSFAQLRKFLGLAPSTVATRLAGGLAVPEVTSWDRTIADRPAACVNVPKTAVNQPVVACVDKATGALLAITGEVDGFKLDMEANNFRMGDNPPMTAS